MNIIEIINSCFMKIKNFLFILLVLLISCKDEDSPVASDDFAVLGIENITIDQTVITIGASGLPEKDNEACVIVGFSYNENSSTRSYDLAVWGTMPEEETINVKSKYDDISTKIEKNVDSAFYNIIISRKGFSEKLVYKIAFTQISRD